MSKITFSAKDLYSIYLKGENKGISIQRNRDYYCYSSEKERFISLIKEIYGDEKGEKIIKEVFEK
jgi:hypothetical protein